MTHSSTRCYTLTATTTGAQTITIPAGARFVAVGRCWPTLHLWALIDPTAPPTPHTFHVVSGVGDSLPGEHVGTSALDDNGRPALHVFLTAIGSVPPVEASNRSEPPKPPPPKHELCRNVRANLPNLLYNFDTIVVLVRDHLTCARMEDGSPFGEVIHPPRTTQVLIGRSKDIYRLHAIWRLPDLVCARLFDTNDRYLNVDVSEITELRYPSVFYCAGASRQLAVAGWHLGGS